MYVVLDTNVWVNAFSEYGNKKYMNDSFMIISDFMQIEDYMLAVDNRGFVLSEYDRELDKNRFYQLFINQLRNGCRIYYVDGTLNSSVRDKLMKLGFHEESDQIFTAVALNTDKYIISDDSDYGTHDYDGEDKLKVHEYMCNELKMRVESSEDGLKSLQERLSKGKAQ